MSKEAKNTTIHFNSKIHLSKLYGQFIAPRKVIFKSSMYIQVIPELNIEKPDERAGATSCCLQHYSSHIEPNYSDFDGEHKR